jgi:hypothetical protein
MHSVRSLVRVRTLAVAFGIGVLLALAAAPAWSGGSRMADPGGNAGNPRVYPPGSNPFGMSYGAWSERWWQWAYGLPVAGHPLFDETGADCAAGQSGPVWFLGGVFNVSGSANRTLCDVPAGKALFFPIIDVEWDNACPPVDPPLSVEELAATAKWYMDLTTNLECEIDGRAIENPWSYRFTAGPFGVDAPTGNIWEYFGCPTPAGHYEPLLADGYFLMLTPLPPGPHVLHFTGTVGDPVNFTLDVTYHLTVVPDSRSTVGALLETGVQGLSGLSEAGKSQGAPSTWGRMKATYR